MRARVSATLAFLLVAACYSGTSGPLTSPCTGPGCTTNNSGPLDAGDGGDGGDAGGDGGDAGHDGGLDAGPCQSFTGFAADDCRTPGQPGPQETFTLTANGCNGTLSFSNTPLCTGALDAGDAFSGTCNEPRGAVGCTAPVLPGAVTCGSGATTCLIRVCGPSGFAPDGGCLP